MFFVTSIHAIAYFTLFAQTHSMKAEMSKSSNILACVAYAGFCLIFFASIGPLRRKCWPIFRVCHHFGIFLFFVGVSGLIFLEWCRLTDFDYMQLNSLIIIRKSFVPGCFIPYSPSSSLLFHAPSPPDYISLTSHLSHPQSLQLSTSQVFEVGGYQVNTFVFASSLAEWGFFNYGRAIPSHCLLPLGRKALNSLSKRPVTGPISSLKSHREKEKVMMSRGLAQENVGHPLLQS